MRTALVEELVALAQHDPTVVLLTGDLGFNVVEPFAAEHPDRFFNVGVAEQNMLGLATGLADGGYTPFVYSIATFASMRPYEFIRNGAVLHNLPVRIVGVGGGVDYAHNGISHFALEDIALMRVQPNLSVLVPASRDQVRDAIRATTQLRGPVYLRLAKGPGAVNWPGPLRLARADVLGDGRDVALIGLGPMADVAVEAAGLLATEGIAAATCVVSSVAPAPVDDLVALLREVPSVVTVEAHYATGGLASLVAEVIAGHGLTCRLARRAIDAVPAGLSGDLSTLHEILGLTAQSVAATALDMLHPAAARALG